MIVQIYPSDEGGCCAYRCRYPADALKGEIETRITLEVPARHFVGGGVEPLPVNADVVVWQRPMPRRETLQLIAGYQSQGVACVVDLDDDFQALHPSHPARHAGYDWSWMRKAAAIADLVTVSTPALAERYGAHGRVMVLRNCVPHEFLELDGMERETPTVGWSGSTVTHPGDLAVTHGGVQDALDGTGWRFKTVGEGDGVRKQLHLREQPVSTGWLPIDGYYRALGSLDVGVVPLADTAFNRAKSYLKGLEMAARGVPFVASPVVEYQRLASEGVGLLAPDRARSWRSQLRKLMESESLRVEMAERARQVIRERHTYEGNGWRWAAAWERAIVNRRASASVRHGVRRDASR